MSKCPCYSRICYSYSTVLLFEQRFISLFEVCCTHSMLNERALFGTGIMYKASSAELKRLCPSQKAPMPLSCPPYLHRDNEIDLWSRILWPSCALQDSMLLGVLSPSCGGKRALSKSYGNFSLRIKHQQPSVIYIRDKLPLRFFDIPVSNTI